MERSWTTSRGGAMRRTGRSEIGDVTVRSLSGGPCVSLLHRGPYELLSRSYGKILDYLEGRGYASNGPIRDRRRHGPQPLRRPLRQPAPPRPLRAAESELWKDPGLPRGAGLCVERADPRDLPQGPGHDPQGQPEEIPDGNPDSD